MQSDDRSDDMLPVLPVELAVIPKAAFSYDSLLPKPQNMALSTEQAGELASFEASFVILGPAAGTVMVCPGNQEGLTDDKRCPYAAKCPLLKMKKAPEGALCPVERVLVEQRFSSWCRQANCEPDELPPPERSAIASLVWIDIQEQRCVNILSTGEAARLTQTNITESVNYTGPGDQQVALPLAWERVLHINAELLARLQEQRMMILKNWQWTPLEKWKVAKAEGKAKGTDLGSKQSSLGDKLRNLDPAYD